MKILVATDKFKGSLSSQEAGKAMAKGVKAALKSAQVKILPMADGGDGFASVMKRLMRTRTIRVHTVDPVFRKIKASYEWDETSKTAIIEMAVASGLVLLKTEERNPLLTSTYGTGLLVKHALEKGATTILLGLGGSATNDGGMGLAAALGFEFFNRDGEKLAPIGASLTHLARIVAPETITSARFSLACDVKNPLYGKFGAAHVYARQKGADEAMMLQLDAGLQNLAYLIEQSTGKDISELPGAGAAGGIASIPLAYFNCDMKSGIDRIVAQTGFHQLLSDVEWLVTGEGCIDEQSLQGKLVGTLLQHATNAGKNTLLVCGQAATGIRSHLGGIPLLSLLEFTKNEATAMQQAAQLLPPLVEQFFSSISGNALLDPPQVEKGC